MAAILRIAMLSLLVAGCASAPPPSALSASVGHNVELTGQLNGPGKSGFYILASNEPVYLADFSDSQTFPIGSEVIVTGKLQRVVPAAGTCAGRSSCPRAVPYTYYFVEDARVRGVP